MTRVGPFRLRRPVLSDIERVYPLSLLASEAKGRQQVRYLKDICRCIADSTRLFGVIFKRDLRHLNALLEAQGLTKDSEVKIPPEQLQQKFNNLISSVAVRLNKTSYELKQNSTAEELERDSIELFRRDLMRSNELMLAYHAPKEHSKHIKDSLAKLRLQSRRLELKKQQESESGTEPTGKVLPMPERRPLFTAMTMTRL